MLRTSGCEQKSVQICSLKISVDAKLNRRQAERLSLHVLYTGSKSRKIINYAKLHSRFDLSFLYSFLFRFYSFTTFAITDTFKADPSEAINFAYCIPAIDVPRGVMRT